MKHPRGISLVEAVFAMTLLAVGALLTSEMLGSSQGAALSDHAKNTAVRSGDQLLRRLSVELTQTTTKIDPTLPIGEEQRFWVEADGVRFQKVDGHDVAADGSVAQRWSPMIRYRWDDATGVVRRTRGAGGPVVVGTGIREFGVALNAHGQIVLNVRSDRGAGNRGTLASHASSMRVTPRNDLR